MGKPTYEPFPEDAGHYASAGDGASSSSALAIDMGPGSSPVILASMERREPRDLVAKLVFSLAGLGLLVSGIVLWTTGNLSILNPLDYETLLGPPTACGISVKGMQRRRMQQGDAYLEDTNGFTGSDDSAGKASLMAVLGVLCATLIASLMVALAYIQGFKRSGVSMVKFSAGVHVGLLLFGALTGFASGAVVGGGIMLALTAIVALCYTRLRHRMELCGRLFGIAGAALCQQPGVLGLSSVLWLVLTVVLLLGSAFGIGAYTNGSPVPNPGLFAAGVTLYDNPTSAGVPTKEATLFNATFTVLTQAPSNDPYGPWAVLRPDHCELNGDAALCCTWEPHGGAVAYLVLLSLYLLWCSYVCLSVRRFCIAGVVAPWFFAPAGAPAPQGLLMKSVRAAAGPQFGTIAASAAVMTLIDLLRKVVDRGTQQRQEASLAGLLCCLLACVARAVLAWIEFLNKFALLWAAMTGQAFIDSGRASTALLHRHLLSSLTVWWMPGMVIFMTSFSFAIFWGMLIWAMVSISANPLTALLTSLASGFAAFMVLQLTGQLVSDVLDAVYLCYALDKDSATRSMPEVHELYDSLPSAHKEAPAPPPGQIVEQPDAGLAYAPGRPDAPTAAGGLQMAPIPHPPAARPPSTNASLL